MLRFGKKLLAAFLSAAIITPALAFPAAASAAEVQSSVAETPEDTNDVTYDEEADASGTDVVSQYSADEVAVDLLVSHTGKSSELENSPAAEIVNNADDDSFISLSCSSELYDSLGFNSEMMKQDMRATAKDPAYQNPLAGYTFVDPNELLVGSVNHTGSHEVLFETFDNVNKTSASDLPGLSEMAKNTTDYAFTEDSNNQTHNGVGIDIDGDGIEELAYYSLFYNSNESIGQKGSSVWVDIFKRVPDGDSCKWQTVHSFHDFMREDNYVLDFEAAETKGYVSLAAGDYDGDGKEELAYYMPDKSGDATSDDARVVVMNIDENNGSYSHSALGSIYVKDFTADYRKMGLDGRLPTVALSTTSTRLGNVKSASVGAKQYETHDDLVMTVSVPTSERTHNLYLNSITKIFTFEGGSAQELFRYEHLPYDNYTKRMNYPNTCDADLNGDGFKELVVAGMLEQNMTKPSNADDTNRNFGTISNKKNLVNIITHNGTKYEMVWDTPVEVEAPGNLSPEHYVSIEPIALCAGHFMYNTPGTKDQLCIQGVILDCQGAKVTGAPIRSGQNGKGETINIIVDSQPHYDKENFGSGVSFSNEYVYGITKESTVHASGDPWVDQCVSGHFLDGTDVDQIAILSSDPENVIDDKIYMDFSIISHYRLDVEHDPQWTYKAFNDYINDKDEDDDGTSMFLAFINSEEDSYYYRYAGTYTTYSAPVLYAVMQAPPYYREANSVATNKFTITSGISDYDKLSLGLGGAVSESATYEESFADMGISLGIGTSIGADFAYNHTWTKQKTITKSIYVKSNDDYAVCYAVPMVVNNYEVVRTKDPEEEPQMAQVTEPMEPMFVALTIDDYNDAITDALDSYTSDPEVLSPDTNTPIIHKSELPPSSAGDPIAYAHTLNDAIGNYSGNKGIVESDINSTIDKAETSVSFSSSSDNSGGVTLKASITFTVGASAKCPIPLASVKGSTSLVLSGSIGYTGGRTTSNGVSFLTTYTGLSTTLPDGVGFSPNSHRYSMLSEYISGGVPLDSDIRHYSPGGLTYAYKTVSVCYPFHGMQADGNDVIVSGYYTEPYDNPPEAPREFSIQSVIENDDGSVDVTLMWNSAVYDQERKADGYNIYMLDMNDSQKELHLQNHEGLIPPKANADYTTYTVHLEETEHDNSLTFYIASAYAELNSGGVYIVYEGNVGSKAVLGNVEEAVNGNLLITEQPETFYMKNNYADETAVYDIEVSKKYESGKPVYFRWELYNKSRGSWKEIETDVAVLPDSNGNYRSECSFTVPGDKKNRYDESGVRCIATCGNYSVRSDIVGLEKDPDPRPVARIQYEGCDGAHLTFKEYASDGLIDEFNCYYNPGDTVKLSVGNAEVFDKGIRLTEEIYGDITNSADLVYDRQNNEIRFTMPSHYVYIEPASIHDFVNGVCDCCGWYEAASKNSDGCYEIKNAGNFLWYAALVNDEHTHADFEQRDSGADAVLMNDIDLENRPFTNIGKFISPLKANNEDKYKGDFDGQGHTISNFYADGSFNRLGMFGIVWDSTIKNLTVKGTIDATNSVTDDDTLLSLIAYTALNVNVTDVTADIDITGGENQKIGSAAGIVAIALSQLNMTRCVSLGDINIDDTNCEVGGLSAEIGMYCVLRDCANLGNVTSLQGLAGGIVGITETASCQIINCCNIGTVTAASQDDADAIAVSSFTNAIENCYYLDTCGSSEYATPKTAAQFASGEVGYLLNSAVTDGTQAWYQNIDNDGSRDRYPLPNNTHGTIYLLDDGATYSNYTTPVQFTLGDVNFDGKIDVRDVTPIQRHLCEYQEMTAKQLKAADTTGDGNITVLDATLLQMYLAEYNVALGNQ